MNCNLYNLLRIVLTVLLATATGIAFSSELSKTYTASFNQSEKPAQIYKFTDFNGNVTYSSTIPDDFIQVEEVAIAPPPSNKYAKETQQRRAILRATAEELGEAREKREAIREEEEKKRLERIALINRSKPPPPVERNVYVARPFHLWRFHHHGKHFQPRKFVQPRINNRRLTHITLPPSSFPSTTFR